MRLGRIHTIDILRGIFILVIIIDHLERFPSGFDIVTGRGQLWVSAAEGFFFVSGMMIGLIRGRKDIKKPLREVAKTLSKRAFILYGWCVGLTFFFTWVTLQGFTGSYIKPGLWQGPISDMINHALSLQYVYSWADFLKYYAVYLLFSIPTIWLLRKNWAWAIALASVVVWWGGGHSEFQNWQLLFFGGTIAGWYWQKIVQYAKQTPAIVRHMHYPLVLVTLAASVVVEQGSITPHLSVSLQPLFDKTDMLLPRVGMFVLWFSALYRFVSTHEALLHKKTGWFFETLGQNSLYCYILSSILIFAAHIYIPAGQPIYVNFVITLLCIVLVWLAARKRFLFKIIPR